MGALLAVAQGSAEEPRFIALEYKGAAGAPDRAGGQGRHLRHRRHLDQAGAEHGGHEVRHVRRRRGARAPSRRWAGSSRRSHVVGLIPTHREHAVGHRGQAGRRGHAAISGKTIEVINTDAEGRLILCDALALRRRYEPACVIDIATLTGAIVVALGHTAAAVMGTDDALIEEVRARRRAGGRAGLAAAAVGRVPRAHQVGHRRREEHRRPAGRQHLGGLVPARVRGRVPLGPPRHRGHRLHRARGRRPG